MNLTKINTSDSFIVDANDKQNYGRYLSEIGKLKPLSREEELNTFIEIQKTNSKEAIDKIYKHNLLFVVSVARKYAKSIPKSSLTLEDLINDGNLGLYEAIHRFDYKSGNKFISYAVWWVKQYILDSIQQNVKSIRTPINIRQRYNSFIKKELELEQLLGRSVSPMEVFNSITDTDNLSINKFNDIMQLNQVDTSLNIVVNDDMELCNLLASDSSTDENIITKDNKELVIGLLKKLPASVKACIMDYYGFNNGIPLSIGELSNKYDRSEAQIKMIITKGIRQLRVINRHKTKSSYIGV